MAFCCRYAPWRREESGALSADQEALVKEIREKASRGVKYGYGSLFCCAFIAPVAISEA